MLYVIIGTDREDSLEARLESRPAHLQRLQQLQQDGRLLLAGPNPATDSEDPGPAGFTGSVIVAEFDDLAAARDWVDEDPYTLNGVFTRVEVKPFKKVLP